jgi:hypothetical protein
VRVRVEEEVCDEMREYARRLFLFVFLLIVIVVVVLD